MPINAMEGLMSDAGYMFSIRPNKKGNIVFHVRECNQVFPLIRDEGGCKDVRAALIRLRDEVLPDLLGPTE